MKEIAQKISRNHAETIANMIADAEYKAKHDEWMKRQQALALSIYKTLVPPNLNRVIAKLPEVIREALPMHNEVIINVYPTQVKDKWEDRVQLRCLGKAGETFLTRKSGTAWTVEDDALFSQAKALDDEFNRMRMEHVAFRTELRDNILAAKTNVKLKAVWPEHEKIIDSVIGVKFDNGSELKDGALRPQSVEMIRARVQKALPAPDKTEAEVVAEDTVQKKAKRKPVTIEG